MPVMNFVIAASLCFPAPNVFLACVSTSLLPFAQIASACLTKSALREQP